MKSLLFRIFFIVFILIGLNGCYTIIWSPDQEFPNQSSSDSTSSYDNAYNNDSYYGDPYYGDYYYYYDIPWWYEFVPPVVSKNETGTTGNNSDIGRIRDSGDGRSNPDRVPDLQPPSKNENPTGNNNDKGSSGNSGKTSTDTSGRNSSSSSSNTTRNDNGGRSSGGRR